MKLLCSMSMALTLTKELTGCDWLLDANILMSINLTQFEVIHSNYIHFNFVIQMKQSFEGINELCKSVKVSQAKVTNTCVIAKTKTKQKANKAQKKQQTN